MLSEAKCLNRSGLFSLEDINIVSMIRKYHNHKLQTNPWHGEEEPHDNHKTPGRKTPKSNQHSLPHQDDCKTRIATKQRTTKHRTITESHNGRNNNESQQQNHRLRTDNSLSHGGGGGGGALMQFTGTKSSP